MQGDPNNKSENIRKERVPAFFDNGAQLSFIRRKLAKRLNLEEIEEGAMKIYSFGDKSPIASRRNRS